VALLSGTRIGVYEVGASLGAGGMGEVYRARDTRLNRDVALKVLPDAFASDTERLARFEREARALAALAHLHIATIYDVLEKDGARALVLELIEGETLAELIARGPVPAAEAVRIAMQIAQALESAHEQGIVHRDLKPANIKITPDGIVKVLDFGLAKLTGPADSGSSVAAANSAVQPDLTMSPTMASPMMVTGAAVLLGTAGYMAPEQARGKPIDRRVDIWAFGVVLYEMLTGRRAFQGETITELAGAVIHTEPDWSALPDATPPPVRMVAERCLQKDPRQRFRDIGDVRLALGGAFVVERSVPVASSTGLRSGGSWIPVVAAAAAAALLAAGAVWVIMRPVPAADSVLRVDLAFPQPRSVAPLMDMSPDGRHVAFVALNGEGVPGVWVRSLDAGESRLLTPREETRQPIFWSADSRYVAFYSEGRLKKVPAAGGPPESIAPATTFLGGSWNRADVILFADAAGIFRVPASGGAPVPVTSVAGTTGGGAHLFPRFLPDGRHFLYWRAGTTETEGIYVGLADAAPQDQSPTRLLATGHAAVYAATTDGLGYVLFAREGLLTAQTFDLERLALVGDPVQVIPEQIEMAGTLATFSASQTGRLIYRRGGAAKSKRLSVFDRTGTAAPLLDGIAMNAPRYPRLAPDGRRLAVAVDGQLWVYDLSGGMPLNLTFDGVHYSSVWTRDGRRLVMEKNGDESNQSLFSIAADGSSAALQPFGPKGHYHPHGWTADGDLVATRVINGGADMDLVRFAPSADAMVREIVVTPTREGNSAAVSPDGRWLAYTSESTGRSELWVQSLSGTGSPVRVSSQGGAAPTWARDGRELYYIENARMMVVPVDTRNGFNFKVPLALFSSEAISSDATYEVTADSRFLAFSADAAPDHPISIILNWPQLLAQRATGH
jgi:eukaryotic-like serine/threonine-protein kinase